MKPKKQPKKQRPQTKKSGPTLETKKSGLTLDPKDLQGRLRFIGGSASDHWNSILVNQATDSLWVAHSEEEGQDRQRSATVVALASIRPKDELEGMIAAQLLAAHNATMECYRRAMLPQQSSEGRSENLNQANKLSRTYVVLLDALNRHRGKGQQKVTVEHVHVHSGGQAVVGMVGAGGVGAHPKLAEQPHAKQIAYAPQPPMWSAPRCRTAGVVCTAESRRALPKGTRTRSSTAAIRPRRLRPGGRLPRC
jgi:hypothetical protein